MNNLDNNGWCEQMAADSEAGQRDAYRNAVCLDCKCMRKCEFVHGGYICWDCTRKRLAASGAENERLTRWRDLAVAAATAGAEQEVFTRFAESEAIMPIIQAWKDKVVSVEQRLAAEEDANRQWIAVHERAEQRLADLQQQLAASEAANQRLRDEVADLEDCREHLRILGKISGCDHVESSDERSVQVSHIKRAFDRIATDNDELREMLQKMTARCGGLKSKLAEDEKDYAVCNTMRKQADAANAANLDTIAELQAKLVATEARSESWRNMAAEEVGLRMKIAKQLAALTSEVERLRRVIRDREGLNDAWSMECDQLKAQLAADQSIIEKHLDHSSDGVLLCIYGGPLYCPKCHGFVRQ